MSEDNKIGIKAHGAPLPPSSAEERLDELQHKLQLFLNGDYPNPRMARPDKCRHGAWYWEACEQCNDDWIKGALDCSKA